MSYGKTERVCDRFKHWRGNRNLCGVCAWEYEDHKRFPTVKEAVFALIFGGKIVGYKKWQEESCAWSFSETWDTNSTWRPTFEHAYSQVELAFILTDGKLEYPPIFPL